MLGLLQLDGYRLVTSPRGRFGGGQHLRFHRAGAEESYAAIREMLELKAVGGIRGVIVSGCLAEREKEALLEQCPEIDYLVGVFGRENVTKVADRLIGGSTNSAAFFSRRRRRRCRIAAGCGSRRGTLPF